MATTNEYLENWQAQVDEIQALESIFEQDFKITAIKGLVSENSLPTHRQNVENGSCSWSAESLAALPDPPSTPWTISCQISIHIDPPYSSPSSEISLEEKEGGRGAWQFAILPRDSGHGNDANGKNERNEAENEQNEAINPPTPAIHLIKYLSPVILSLELPSTYPSSTASVFSIAAMWLSHRQAAEIESELLKLWDLSMPVIWTWADWLQNSLMQFLVQRNREQIPGYTNCCEYQILEAAAESDTGVVNGNGSDDGGDDDDTIESSTLVFDEHGIEGRLIGLLHYSVARESQLFRQDVHTCSICFEEQRGTQFLRLECRHVFCTSCILEQSNLHIREGTLDALKCPEPGCNEPLAAHTLRQILEPEIFERWETLTLQRALDQMSDAAYCPRCGTLSLEDLSDNCADCPKCFFVFCTLCNEGRHPGVQCVSVETRLAMLRRKVEGGGSAAVAELRKKEHEMMSLAFIEKSTKPCPACGMAIQRSEGCNKMVCGNCNAFFCYKCGKQISGYDHYKAGVGECVLFDQMEILRWERRWQQEQAGAHAAAAAFRNDYLLEFGGDFGEDNNQFGGNENINRRGGNRGDNGGGGGDRVAPLPMSNCPSCGQPNYRFARNNHLHCWSCTRHFCAVCRTVLQRRGGGMHFGPKGCPQHS
jgi:E3 ubiquitin-protein ligase RNF14